MRHESDRKVKNTHEKYFSKLNKLKVRNEREKEEMAEGGRNARGPSDE
mgnify:CR=1 FL=1